MTHLPIIARTRTTSALALGMVTIAATSCMLIGCRSGSPPNVAESKGKPTPVPVSQTDSVSELVDMFLTNRDWTESLPMAEQEEWERTHPGWSPPVIDHDDQTQAAFQLTQLGPKAKAAAPAMIKSLASTNRLTRHWAIQVLQAIGSASPEVVPALVHELDNRNTANEAADALIIISLTDTNVLARVMERLESDIDLPEAKSSARVPRNSGRARFISRRTITSSKRWSMCRSSSLCCRRSS